MTPAQTALYFREWGRVRAHYLAKGIDPKQADHKRHELHRRALGVDKSSKTFTNADLDKVLAVFRAITEPGNLTAQLRQLEQPEQRTAGLRQGCREFCLRLPKIAAAKAPEQYALNYLDQLARSVVGCRFDDLDEKELARIYGILRHRRVDKNPF